VAAATDLAITMPKLPPRLTGLVLLLASGGTTLVHRSIWEAARHGPAQVAEFGIGLATFMLASVGVLLVIHGGKLFALDTLERGKVDRQRRPRDLMTELLQPVRSSARALDTRQGVAAFQAAHLIRVAQHRTRRRRSTPALR
jgi:hypothetical protein